jgi:N6-L-threonylcarbamoyladenine synthase
VENLILAIESSCDDTSVALVKGREVLSNITASQSIHSKHGGVVPELASRAHQQHILPVILEALEKANKNLSDINAIAYTLGPGLMGSLLVGVSVAKGLSISLKIPLIEVNHMQAHILAHMEETLDSPTFPFLSLTVSGGHTQLVKVKSALEMEVIGETIDDAAGEAFDKTAKIIGLPYPGGPLIDKYAQLGNPIYSFTEPKVKGLNFSFSGLKTAILYFIQRQKNKDEFIKENLNDICSSVQHTIVSILIKKVKAAMAQEKLNTVAICGGVSANSSLRNMISITGKENGWKVHIPPIELSTDNAAMIGIAASYKLENRMFGDLNATPKSRLKI